jgi:hypothetical protein
LAFSRFETAVDAGSASSCGGWCATCCRLINLRFLEKSLTFRALLRFSTSSSEFRSGFSLPSCWYSPDTFPV